MRSKRKQTFVRFVSAALCLSMLINCAGGLVLCIGHNGHVAIETSGQDCCEHSGHDDHEAAVVVSASATVSKTVDGCGGCVDIPLSAGFASLSDFGKQVNLVVISSGPMTDVPAGGFSLARHGPMPETFIPSPCLSALSSIILLI